MNSLANSLNIFVFAPEISSRSLLGVLLEEAKIERTTMVSTLTDAREAYERKEPDICFLDVSGSRSAKVGLELAAEIRRRNRRTPFIFIVSSTTDATYRSATSFSQSSVMHKDISRTRLLQAIKYAKLQIENGKLSRRLTEDAPHQNDPGGGRQDNPLQLFFKIGDSFRRIEKEKISFFFAENKMTYAQVGKRRFPTTVQLKTLEQSLKPGFVRCHKKFILNVAHIESISLKVGKVKVGEELLPIGYSYRKAFLSSLNLLR